jgi:hypothetical protein
MSDNDIPVGIVAGLLNAPTVIRNRTNYTGDGLPYVHVSDLLKNSSSDKFCQREFVLKYFERRLAPTGTVPAKMRLLWDTGNLIGDFAVIKRFKQTSVEYGHLIWGDWRCDACDHLHTFDYCPSKCSSCGSDKLTYSEVDLRLDDVRLVGHPDLLFRMEDGTIIVYELKTIDRQDIIFSQIEAPLGDHHVQASLYYYLLKRLGYKVSQTLRFIYIDRSMDNMYTSSPFREIGATVLSPKRIQPLIEVPKKLVKHIVNRTLPDRICKTCTDTRTTKCLVVTSCFGRRSNKITPMS